MYGSGFQTGASCPLGRPPGGARVAAKNGREKVKINKKRNDKKFNKYFVISIKNNLYLCLIVAIKVATYEAAYAKIALN